MTTTYGTTWIDTARGKLKALIDDLITDTAIGYDPKISHVYEKHHQAYLQLNAVTIDFRQAPIDFAATTSQATASYKMIFTMRVHTAYENRIHNGQKISRLLNSVVNKLLDNVNLDDAYFITDVQINSNNESFEESATIGGEIEVIVEFSEYNTQE